MKNNIILVIKGFFMGIANIIPGVSGGTLAITMGIYEDLIKAVSHFFKNLKKNILFIVPIGIGAVLAIALGSKIISFSLEKYPLPTILFFIGLILGGFPMLYGKVEGSFHPKNLFIFCLTFAFIIGIMFLKTGKDVQLNDLDLMGYILLFVVGVIAAATMIIPGISGSFMLMVMGYYEPILHAINELTSFKNIGHNISIFIPIGFGILIGTIGIAKIIEYLFKKYEVPTYYGIMGFVLASIIGIFASTEGLTLALGPLFIGGILFIIGFVIAYRLGE